MTDLEAFPSEEPTEVGRLTTPDELTPTIPEIANDDLGSVARLFYRAHEFRARHFTRPVTTFTSKDGEKYRASADQVEVTIDDPANVKVWLKTHDKEIAMTIGGLLLAAGLFTIQKNRSQRKKMSPRASSTLRPPRR